MRRAFFFIVAVCLATSSFASIPRASARIDAPSAFDPLPETRIRVSEDLAPFERTAPSLLSRALHQAYEQASTTSASGLAGFLSVDPLLDVKRAMRNPQEWNRYSYTRNNPVNRIDPDGRQTTGAEWVVARAHMDEDEYLDNTQAYGRGALVGAALGFVAVNAPSMYRAAVSLFLGNPNRAIQFAEGALAPPGPGSSIPGRVQSRINLADGPTRFSSSARAGMQHVIADHFTAGKNKGLFSISVNEFKSIVSSKAVVGASVTPLASGQFSRVVDAGHTIGTVKPSMGGAATSWMQIITDRAGNLVTAFPVAAPK